MDRGLHVTKMLFMVSILVFCCTSCVFTVSDEPISPSYNGKPQASLRPISLEVGAFQDSREVNDPRKLLSKLNAYGPTSGYIRSEKAAKDVLRDVIIDALSRSGADLSSSHNKYLLSGSLAETRSEVSQGILVVTVSVIVSAKFKLINTKTNEIAWQDTIEGRSSKDKTFFGSKFLASLFKDALDNLSENLIHDEYFLQVIKK